MKRDSFCFSVSDINSRDSEVVRYLSSLTDASGNLLFEVRLALIERHISGHSENDGLEDNYFIFDDYYSDTIGVQNWLDLDGKSVYSTMSINFGKFDAFHLRVRSILMNTC